MVLHTPQIMRLAVKAVIVNVIGILVVYFVRLDLTVRSSCGSLTLPFCRAPIESIAYGPLTLTTQLASSGIPLLSPLTLDWSQVALITMVIVDLYALYRVLSGGKNAAPSKTPQQA